MKHPELEPEVMAAAKERLANMGLTHYEQNFPVFCDTFEKPASPEDQPTYCVHNLPLNVHCDDCAKPTISPEQATTALGRVRARREAVKGSRNYSRHRLVDGKALCFPDTDPGGLLYRFEPGEPPKKPADAESSIGCRLADLLESRDQAREKWLEYEQLAQEKLAIYTALDAELRAAIDSLRGVGQVKVGQKMHLGKQKGGAWCGA